MIRRVTANSLDQYPENFGIESSIKGESYRLKDKRKAGLIEAKATAAKNGVGQN